jgi:hypothetical protein
VGDHGEIDLILLHSHSAGVQPGKVEQIRGELRQARHLLAHRQQKLLTRRFVELLVRHQLEKAAEREERRSELVGGVRDELAAGSIEVLEPLPHSLERCCQLADLVVATIHDRLVEATARNPFGRTLEPPDPACVQRGTGVSQDHGHQQGDQTRGEQASLDDRDAGERVGE